MLLTALVGLGVARDALGVAMRLPNVLQNLLGEGSLSASFIPVYSRLVADRETQRAGRLAGAVLTLLVTAVAVFVLVVFAFTRPLVDLMTFYGLGDARLDLAVSLTRITTLGIAFLVPSAWCLGILNSHRQFFLSYVAPVVWNIAQIVVLVAVVLVGVTDEGAVKAVAWAVVVGGFLQFAVQYPSVRRAVPALRISFGRGSGAVRDVVSKFGHAVVGRGAAQISSFVDLGLAALLATGAIGALLVAQVLYLLPISLFAMSIAAAELPELSTTDDTEQFSERLLDGSRRSAFFVLFTAGAYVSLGDWIIASLYQRGDFTADDTLVVWTILAAFAVALPATASSRVLQAALFALGDAKGPSRIAIVRVLISAAVGVVVMFSLDRVTVVGREFRDLSDAIGLFGPLEASVRSAEGAPIRLGAAGLAIGAAVASWVEMLLLRRYLVRHHRSIRPPRGVAGPLAVPLALSFVVAAFLKLVLQPLPVIVAAVLALGVSGFVYTVAAFRNGVAESQLVLRPIRRVLYR